MPGRGLTMLVGIGLLSGFFGALFGVGGGIVIVPLLVLYGYDQRRASATSLAAILVSSLVGAITYAFHGDVKPGAAALVGIPAVAGVLVGTGLHRRLSVQKLTYGFALLLAAVGVRLLA
ncbi:MAG: sulfite exporter TauE/SafE family protein [Gaiellaceae bacterium]